MGIDRSQFQIEIKTTADLAGAKASLENLRAQFETAKKAGTELKGLADQINRTKDSISQYEGAIKKAAREEEGFEIHGHTAAHGLHLIADAAGEIDPALGGISELARMARSPDFLVPSGALIAFKMLNDEFEKLIESAMKLDEWFRQLKASARDASEEAVRGMEAEVAAFDLRMKHLFDGENAAAKAIANRLVLYNSEIDHERQLMDIDSQRFEAYIKYLVKIGKLTPAQAESATDAHKQAQGDAKEREDERKAHAAITAKEDERAGAQGKLNADPAKLSAAEAAKKAAVEAANLNQKNTEQEKGRYKEMDDAAKEAEARAKAISVARKTFADPTASSGDIGAAQVEMTKIIAQDYAQGKMSFMDWAKSSPDNFVNGKFGKADEQEARGLRGAADTQRAHVDRMEGHQVTLDDKVKEADADVKKWQDEIAEATKSVHDLTEAIAQATKELTDKQNDYRETRAAAQRATQANQFYEDGPRDRESADLFAHTGLPGTDQYGRRQTAADTTSAAINKVTKEVSEQSRNFRGHTAHDDQVQKAIDHIVAIFASHADLTQQQQQKLLELERKLKDIHTRLSTTGGNW